ncbi:MAG TPA: beta-lactamase family protein [Clostridiaceae bacterium]|nr:beta-lactamase family protein [Clostridiaceae bacterium]
MRKFQIRSLILSVCIGLVMQTMSACEPKSKVVPEIQAIRLQSDVSRNNSAVLMTSENDSDEGVPNYTIEQVLIEAGVDDFQGIILVSEQDRIVYQSFSGRADVESDLLLDAETNFEVGRISWQVTSACIRLLVDQGLITLDDTLSLYMPEYSFSDRVTIRQMLDMSSGIPDYLDNTLADPSYHDEVFANALYSDKGLAAIYEFENLSLDMDLLIEKLNTEGLRFTPGSDYLFSHTNNVLLAEVVERISGIPYVHFAQKNVLTPLGLEAAAFEQSSKTATPYVARNQIQTIIGPTNLSTEAGLRMNASDLLIWTFAIRDLLKDWQRRELPVAGEDGIIPADLAANDYRLFGVEWIDESFLGIESEIGGFDCIQVFDPQRDIVILILSNRNSIEPLCENILEALLDHYSFDTEEDLSSEG